MITVRPSHPTTPAVALAVRLEHWTPKGDCKVTGNKKEIKMNRPKKKLTKIEIDFFLRCPSPCSLPSGSSALTLRRAMLGRERLGWDVNLKSA